MAKKNKVGVKEKTERRKDKREKERKQIDNNELIDDLEDNNELDNDFFVEDADEADYNQIDDDEIKDENLSGSDLDFDDEDEELGSIVEEEEDEEEEKKGKKKEKKPFVLTKEQYKKIKEKTLEGNNFYISKSIIIFSKAINLGVSNNENDIEYLEQDEEMNILADKDLCLKVIKFCLTDLFDVINIKPSKAIIKRYLGIIYHFVKKGDLYDPSLMILTFKQLYENINLIKMFKVYTEVFIKLGVKYWLNLDYEGSAICLAFLREMAMSGEFEFVVKSCYLGFLDTAKTTNDNTYEKIHLLMENIIFLIKSGDSQIGYKSVFLFLRKLSIELNRTIMDKKWSSIKNIYNWQVVNSIILWIKLLTEVYKSDSKWGEDYKLLSYPLIQICVGVIRLYLVANFFPLRIILLEHLINFSAASGIFIPIENYILEMVESSVFAKFYKEKEDKASKQPLDLQSIKDSGFSKKEKKKLKNKLSKQKKIAEQKKGKHALTKIDKRFHLEDLYITLKIKDFNSYQTTKDILQAIIKLLLHACNVYSSKITFCEYSFPIISSLKKIYKNILEREFKDLIKSSIEVLEASCNFIDSKRLSIKDRDSISVGSKGMAKVDLAINKKFGDEIPLRIFLNKLEKKAGYVKEAKAARDENKFIEI